MRKIFIGSSSESRAKAERVAQVLSETYEVKRWWTQFAPGDFTLTRLMETAKTVEGALFLFTGDDELKSRDTVSPCARDNLLVEFGLFLAHLGLEKTLLVHEKGTRLPSDLNGLAYQRLSGDVESLAEQTRSFFDRRFAPASGPVDLPVEFLIRADMETVENTLTTPPPPNWCQRVIYSGTAGARAWLEVTKDSGYGDATRRRKLQTQIRDAVDRIPVGTIVSFGPGDGRVDCEILSQLNNKYARPTTYIPVDISEGLLFATIESVGGRAIVPCGILTDFESRLGFVSKHVAEVKKAPVLYSMLGNTFGNLDEHETLFLDNMVQLLSQEDYLLLEVELKGKNWSFERDPWSSPRGYSTPMRRLIANGIARRMGESVENVLDKFDSCITFVEGECDVPGATAVDICYGAAPGEPRRILSVRRYDWQALLDWLQREGRLSLVHQQRVDFKDGILGVGVIVAQRPSRNGQDQ